MTRPNWSIPDARLVLGADATRDEWLAERRNGIGGSDAATLAGATPYQSAYGLWFDKTGQADDVEQTDPMWFGHEVEPILAGKFTKETGVRVRRAGLLANRGDDWMRANVDRLTADGGILEMKSTMGHTEDARAWRHGIAHAAYVQAQWYLAVTGRTHAWFIALVDKTPIVRGPVKPDGELMADVFDRAVDMWKRVQTLTPPEVDLATITDEEIAQRWPSADVDAVETDYPNHVRALLDERAEQKATEKAARERSGEIDRALRVLARDAEALTVDGRPLVTFKPVTSRRVDTTALKAAEPELAERFTTATTTRRIHIPKGSTTA